MIKLSVIIPNYNKAGYIDTLLEHLKQQMNDEIEVIVVDDASTDNSWEIISKYSDIFRTFRNNTNMYNSYTRNVGIENAKGKYVTFIDSDDDIKPWFIETIFNSIKSNRDAYFFDYSIHNVQGSFEVEKCFNTMVWSKVYKRKFLNDNNIRFDVERFPKGTLCEDFDFNLQVIEKTQDIEKSNLEIIIYNWGISQSVSNDKQTGNYEPRYEVDKEFMEKWFKM